MRLDGSLSIRRYLLDKPLCLFNGEVCHLRNSASTNRDRQCFRLESSAVTISADACGDSAFSFLAFNDLQGPIYRAHRRLIVRLFGINGLQYAKTCTRRAGAMW